jgi:hypothetical protein
MDVDVRSRRIAYRWGPDPVYVVQGEAWTPPVVLPSRMLTYADLCRRTLTYADVPYAVAGSDPICGAGRGLAGTCRPAFPNRVFSHAQRKNGPPPPLIGASRCQNGLFRSASWCKNGITPR